MPSGAKKRKAAKKREQQQASSTLKSTTNHDSRSQGDRESDDGVSSQENYKKAGFTGEEAVRIEKERGLDTDERIEIIDSSHDHDKSSSSSGSGNSSSSSDDESQEVKRKDGGDKETGEYVSEVITVSSVPVPVAGDAPFMGSTANVIVENTGLMDSTTPSHPNTENVIEISSVDAIISNEPVQSSLHKPNEVTAPASIENKQASSSTTGSDKKENKGKTSFTESKCVPEGSRESEVVISHEEEASVRPTHGVAQRTSWLSCCGLFDVMTGSSR